MQVVQTAEISFAIQALIAKKEKLDQELKREAYPPAPWPEKLLGAFRYSKGIEPIEFAEAILPFFKRPSLSEFAQAGEVVALPFAQVVGMPPVRWLPDEPREIRLARIQEFEEQIDAILQGDTRLRLTGAKPSCWVLPALGLCLPHEGKHRPLIYRAERINPRYPVTECSYPEAKRIALVKEGQFRYVVLEGSSPVQLHPYFQVELEMLFSAYGVRERTM